MNKSAGLAIHNSENNKLHSGRILGNQFVNKACDYKDTKKSEEYESFDDQNEEGVLLEGGVVNKAEEGDTKMVFGTKMEYKGGEWVKTDGDSSSEDEMIEEKGELESLLEETEMEEPEEERDEMSRLIDEGKLPLPDEDEKFVEPELEKIETLDDMIEAGLVPHPDEIDKSVDKTGNPLDEYEEDANFYAESLDEPYEEQNEDVMVLDNIIETNTTGSMNLVEVNEMLDELVASGMIDKNQAETIPLDQLGQVKHHKSEIDKIIGNLGE